MEVDKTTHTLRLITPHSITDFPNPLLPFLSSIDDLYIFLFVKIDVGVAGILYKLLLVVTSKKRASPCECC